MSCKHPMVRYEYPEGDFRILSLEKIQKLGLNPQIDILNRKGKSPIKEQKIPCGRCIACRLNYSATWANRLCLELKNIPEKEKWFLTLTYSPEHLHTTQGIDPETGEIYTSNRLDMRDVQLFIKRLRKNCAEKITHHEWTGKINFTDPKTFRQYEGTKSVDVGLRYFYCGEYGEKTQRAHYHMIVWNLKLDESRLEKFRKNELGQQLWKCPELEEIWQKGHVVVGKVSWESIAYTARYMLKKQKGLNAEIYYKLKGQIAEFCHMSRMPGIAYEYYTTHKEDIYKYDEIAIMKKKGAFKIKPPRYFDMLYDIEEPEKMEEIKKHREEVAKDIQRMKLSKTTVTETELLQIEENSIKEKSQKLVRSLD